MKSKKILLGSLSAIALVATPITAVVSCGKHVEIKPVAKVLKETKITKTKATGFVINFNGKQFVTAEQAKAGGSVVVIFKGKPTTLSWDKQLEAGTKVSFKTLLKGEEITTPEGNEFTPTQADDKHFALIRKGTSTGEYKTLAEVKQGFGDFVSLHDGQPKNGVKLLFDKTTNAVTTEGIKIFNDLLKETGLVVASATVTIKPAVGASGSSAGTPSQKQVSITWGSNKPVVKNTDVADVAAVKALLVTNAITPAVATDAVAAITTATPITDLASLNTATPNIVFSATGALPTGAALKGVSIKIKSLTALAATGSATGNLVIELSKGQATDIITIAVVGKA